MNTIWTYWDKNAVLEFKKDNVRLYRMGNQRFLFENEEICYSTSERNWYVKNVMPYAKGKALQIGLGLGLASKCILLKRKVNHLLTVEENENIIEAHGKTLTGHNILYKNPEQWLDLVSHNGPTYDFIFVENYVFDDEILENLPNLAEKYYSILKPNGNIIFWIDENAEEEDQRLVKSLWKTPDFCPL